MESAQHRSTQHNSENILFETICFLGGAKFAGVQASFLDKHGKRIPRLVLFNSPRTGSTLGLYENQLSASAVRAKIAESDLTFDAYAEKAAQRIFASFNQKPVVRSVVAVAA